LLQIIARLAPSAKTGKRSRISASVNGLSHDFFTEYECLSPFFLKPENDKNGLSSGGLIDQALELTNWSFRAYIEQFLIPTLSAGDVVIMDNLGSHKGKTVRRLIRSVGAKLFFLPRYSPGSQSDRTGLRQAQGPATQDRPAHDRDHWARHR
jgi:hypothetical protein